MHNNLAVVILAIALGWGCAPKKAEEVYSVEKARQTLDFAALQYKNFVAAMPDTLEPRTFQGDTMVYAGINWWTSGFYPGSLWYLYEYTKDDFFKLEADKRTRRLDPIKYVTTDHDVGFMLYCSYGNGLRLTGNQEYADVLLLGARSLSTRFNPVVSSIKSWDWTERWSFPVIIDNMMNLELLMWAAKTSHNDTLQDISLTHAFTSLKNHYRADYSCFHVIDYDPETGEIIKRNTHQGFAHESAWARGQSWGLYGFVMMYRETGEQQFLDHAINVANFLLDHPNLPEDKIPYWDYDDPDIPNSYRDSSAGSIMASALLELSTMLEGAASEKYFTAAEHMLATLTSDQFLAKEGENGNFLLMHGVGHLPGNSEVDVPLTYGDYYFIEALLRYVDLKS